MDKCMTGPRGIVIGAALAAAPALAAEPRRVCEAVNTGRTAGLLQKQTGKMHDEYWKLHK